MLQQYSTTIQRKLNTTFKVRKHIVQEGEILFLRKRHYNVSGDEIKKENLGIDSKYLQIKFMVNILVGARNASNVPAGIMSNLLQESGMDFKKNQYNGEVGRGIDHGDDLTYYPYINSH
ncbi:hypothetical protein IAW_05809 [Bacillus cereus str. Schrouff]|uniref:hypothetical protein n=1 Tax=Bacillus cereus TaxID=1396 RepID=UPI00032E773E|nr:hypothetical protein [Bacillus cereus]EOO04991.1 hypothetical protein IAW_05809 [Bacillus cereus str. Schrouff]EOO81675.1 hypothetical protein IGY_05697 [Bacillus cereus K-5975c]